MQLFSMLRTKTLDSVAVGLQDAHLRMHRPFEPVSDSSRVLYQPFGSYQQSLCHSLNPTSMLAPGLLVGLRE